MTDTVDPALRAEYETLLAWWRDAQWQYGQRLGDLAFEEQIRHFYTLHRQIKSDLGRLRPFISGATWTLLYRVDNPFPDLDSVTAGEMLMLPQNRDLLVRVFRAAAQVEAGWTPEYDEQEDPRMHVRCAGLMLGLTADEMGPLVQ